MTDAPTQPPGDGSEAADPRFILDLLPSGVVALDEEGRARYVNASALAILGVGSNGIGRNAGLGALVGHGTVAGALASAIRDRQERRLAIIVTRPDDSTTELGLTVVPGHRSHGGPKGAGGWGSVLHFRPLDDSSSLNRRMLEVEELSAIGRLGAGFAHEVLNPVAAIQGLAEGLLDELPDDDPLGEYGERILGLVVRVESLVRSFVELGREPEAPFSKFKAEELVTLALDRVEGSSRVVTTIEAGSTSFIEADPRQIIKGLQALIDNGVEAAEGEEPVEIFVRPAPGEPARVEVEVRDRGPGIPEPLLNRVFEPFFTTKPGSTGLGLTMARLAAVKNRGSLEVRSRPGETCFTLTLPVDGRPGAVEAGDGVKP